MNMTQDAAQAVQDHASGEAATQLRKFWTDSIEHAKAHGHSEADVVVQMLAVATKAAERCFGADAAAQLYTDQAVLLMGLKAEREKTIAEAASAPKH